MGRRGGREGIVARKGGRNRQGEEGEATQRGESEKPFRVEHAPGPSESNTHQAMGHDSPPSHTVTGFPAIP